MRNSNEKIIGRNEAVTHYDERIQNQRTEIERLEATAQKIFNYLNHELRLPLGNVINFAEILKEGLLKLSDKDLKMITDELYKNSNRLSTITLNMLDSAILDVNEIELKKEDTHFTHLVETRIRECARIYLQGKPLEIKVQVEINLYADVDANYMRQVVDNLLINTIKYTNNGIIKVDLRKVDKNIIEFKIQDEGIGIPENEIYDIFTSLKTSSKTESKAQGRRVGLPLCKRAIEAHGGTITVESDGTNGVLFKVRIPIRS